MIEYNSTSSFWYAFSFFSDMEKIDIGKKKVGSGCLLICLISIFKQSLEKIHRI